MTESQEYLDWLNKFKVKKTTDSCFTPAAVYEVVKDWAVEEYSLQGRRILRPFHPEGDYQAENYPENCVVIDNPPFSIASEIVKFYEARNIKYFLFANHLTLFRSNAKCSIVVARHITYENGAKINTSFLTNLDTCKIRTAPELKAAIDLAERKGNKKKKPAKNYYPLNVVTAALLDKISELEFSLTPQEVSKKIAALDSQRKQKRSLYGSGFLISDKAAARLEAAFNKAEKLRQARARDWTLSDREKEIISGLE